MYSEGIDIDPDDADTVIDVFQRLHTDEEHLDNGIAFALFGRIVEREGDSNRVDSEPGEGATCYFTLPATGVKASVRGRRDPGAGSAP